MVPLKRAVFQGILGIKQDYKIIKSQNNSMKTGHRDYNAETKCRNKPTNQFLKKPTLDPSDPPNYIFHF